MSQGTQREMSAPCCGTAGSSSQFRYSSSDPCSSSGGASQLCWRRPAALWRPSAQPPDQALRALAGGGLQALPLPPFGTCRHWECTPAWELLLVTGSSGGCSHSVQSVKALSWERG